MPRIISSTKLRNEYNEISSQAHRDPEPIFVTRNGNGDLAIMSIEAYEALARRAELVNMLAAGHADVERGRTVDADEALSALRREFSR
ncbi:type II toxin-antitoxin system Phd/YefM family antitoxin [Olsenella sp. Marseille-P4559]|uniref:type II toxin-antitoxin system Phd/YefM family antitoxin n=1 Tax=Olsenella sp. Marseille-P4559 TaxID=2364795 RepID=UPI0010302542|nr:type II toxin-antitoxin system Phd/YefM family antitoxin [Olsenella sp. Marseille-P4559]